MTAYVGKRLLLLVPTLLGVSVLTRFRRRGIGSALVSRAANHARAAGMAFLSMYCLAENATILRIAKSLGMRVVRFGPSAEAVLALNARDSIREALATCANA